MRGFLELLRTDSLMLGNIRVSSILSFTICIAGVITMAVVLNRQNVKAKETAYVPMFVEEADEESTEEILSEETKDEQVD
jgi:prolipoprotein diacylglyceryltransferase